MTDVRKFFQEPADSASAAHAAIEWIRPVVDEFRLRASVYADRCEGSLVQAAAALGAIEGVLRSGNPRDEHLAHLESVALQLVFWDCNPARPEKATWLSMAADDFSDAVVRFRHERERVT